MLLGSGTRGCDKEGTLRVLPLPKPCRPTTHPIMAFRSLTALDSVRAISLRDTEFLPMQRVFMVVNMSNCGGGVMGEVRSEMP